VSAGLLHPGSGEVHPVPVDPAADPAPDGADPAAEQALQDELAEAADRAQRPLTRSGRRARAPVPPRLSPGRAMAGAAVSVSGVLLGIGTLLWLSDDPSQRPGPAVQAPPPAAADAFATQPENETAPVDPVEVAPPPVAAPAAPPPAAAAPAAPAAPAARPAVAEIPVTVLNNSRREGLADLAAARFRAGGWPVAATGNFRGKIPVTTVYYEPGQEAVARAFADRFDGVRVRPRYARLPVRGLVVVVTREFAR
jgi:hypothetical protein